MRKAYFVLIAITLLTVSSSFAQQRPPVPRGSQKATVVQTLGTTDISVTYSRPVILARKVFGDWPSSAAGEATLDNSNTRPANAPLVPWGHVWRAGANEATLFTVADDVLINGQLLPAGKYSLHAIPTKEEWTIIFNKDDGQWGSFSYDAKKDALRVKAKPEWLNDSTEMLTYEITPDLPSKVGVPTSKGSVALRWEKVRVPFTVEVKDVVASTMTRLREFVAAAPAGAPGPFISAATFAKDNKQTAEATKWFEEALARTEAQLASKENFDNLNRKANILLQLDRRMEALAAAERALVVGKADPAVSKAAIEQLEKRIADAKAAKP